MRKEEQQRARHEVTGGVPALAREHHRNAETAALPREDGSKEGGSSVVTNVDTDELDLLESELASDSAFEEEESMALLAKPVQHPSMDDSGIALNAGGLADQKNVLANKGRGQFILSSSPPNSGREERARQQASAVTARRALQQIQAARDVAGGRRMSLVGQQFEPSGHEQPPRGEQSTRVYKSHIVPSMAAKRTADIPPSEYSHMKKLRPSHR